MTIKELRQQTGLSPYKFGLKFHIPVMYILHWEEGSKKPPEYIEYMIEKIMVLEDTLDQVRWERNVAIDQLKQLGYSLGEKIKKE